MRFPTFQLERNQTLYENAVEINLTESGVHPCTVGEILDEREIAALGRVALSHGYTEGSPALRRAIADWYPGTRAENIVVCHGSSEACLVAVLSIVSRGDEIVVIVPNFMQIDGLARALDATVHRVPLDEAKGWQPDLAQVRAAIGPRTRLITVCDPNNPTGTMLTDASRRGLAELAAERGIWLLVDEIYRGSEIDGGEPATAWGLSDRVIVSGGLSKSFACPGLRLGWLVAPPELADECHRRQDYTTIGTGTLPQLLAERVMQPARRDRMLAQGRSILARGRATVAEWVAGRNSWSWVEPKAGGMAFLGYGFEMPSEALVQGLREEESVFVCAGAWFGIEKHIRIGIGVEHAKLVEGLRRIDSYVARHGASARGGGPG
jgi:aspartate/methionine/tyrosine aminotransferase